MVVEPLKVEVPETARADIVVVAKADSPVAVKVVSDVAPLTFKAPPIVASPAARSLRVVKSSADKKVKPVRLPPPNPAPGFG